MALRSLRGEQLRRRVLELFESRWVGKSQEAAAVAEIGSELDGKLAQVEQRKDPYRKQLLGVVRQLRSLWNRRDQLKPRHVGYLAAALLYFISPLDAIPDIIPGLGFADDLIVLTFVLRMIVNAVSSGADVLKGRADEVIRSAEQAAERAAESLVPRSVAAIAIGLWGMTTAAAISLSLAIAHGGITTDWAIYAMVVAGLTTVWNVAAAWSFVTEFRRLSGTAQEKIVRIFASKITLRHALTLGVPVVLLVALGVGRAFLAFG